MLIVIFGRVFKSLPPRFISFKHPRLSHPKRDNLPLRHTAHQTTPWSPTLTPHRDAFLHHLWGGVAQYSVWEIGPDKIKWGIRGEGGRTLLTNPGYSRPAHFLSRVAGSGDIVHRPDYTPNHQRSQLGTLPRRIVGVSMTNGTRHDLCISRHWAMRCPAWTLTRTSHNRVVNKIRPNTDVASISSVLHLVWPLARSLSSMVVPTRSQNSSWHSLWDLQGTQAPQLRQSSNTLGGIELENLLFTTILQLVMLSTEIMDKDLNDQQQQCVEIASFGQNFALHVQVSVHLISACHALVPGSPIGSQDWRPGQWQSQSLTMDIVVEKNATFASDRMKKIVFIDWHWHHILCCHSI